MWKKGSRKWWREGKIAKIIKKKDDGKNLKEAQQTLSALDKRKRKEKIMGKPSKEKMIEMYKTMVKIRKTEQKLMEVFSPGKFSVSSMSASVRKRHLSVSAVI